MEETTLKVVIRVRPLNRKEKESNRCNIWNIDCTNGVIVQYCNDNKIYSFDRVYSPLNTTRDLYIESVLPVIKSFIDGFNGTIFAYGQTSSGKTYTMMGSGNNKEDGIIHKAIKYIFQSIRETPNRQFAIRVCYLEIYNESIKDLLNTKNIDLKISMDNFHRPIVRGLTVESPMDTNQVFNILKEGMLNRNIGSTKMNDHSSRSHTIFQILLESRIDDDSSVRSSILNIVDLAGSERAKKTDATGKRLKEGGHINKSLLTLGIVIKKLSENNANIQHIPYRDSKLTHILEAALGGNSKTLVIATMTPADIHGEESISTLGFASRAKEIKNVATIIEVIDDATLIRQQKKQIIELQELLKEKEKENANTNKREIIINTKQKHSVLGKRKRRHSIAIELNGSPARKRLKTQICHNNNLSTPINKIRSEKDEISWKLRKATQCSKSLQIELNAKYKDFNEMQLEIDRLRDENNIYKQKIIFFESSINKDSKEIMIENQRLHLNINELQQKLYEYKEENGINGTIEIENKLREELKHSHNTIDQLQGQIAELRLNIEKQQKIIYTSSSKEVSPDIHINMNLHKLQSQILLIKTDRVSIQQEIQNERQKFISFKDECYKQLKYEWSKYENVINILQCKLEESNDEKHLFESQYHSIREERDEMRNELEILRRPQDEIIDELQNELLNIEKQNDIDINHTFNVQNELEDKQIEINNLNELRKQINDNQIKREKQLNDEYENKIRELNEEIINLKKINEKLECERNININNGLSLISSYNKSKIDTMNTLQLKDTLKNTKKLLRELQTKISSIQRKKDNHEKTALKYTKRCRNLEERYNKSQRENNSLKSDLLSMTKNNKRLNIKNEKLLKDIKKTQNDIINGNDLKRKLNLITKRLESLTKKHNKLNNEHNILSQENILNIKQINELKDNLNDINIRNKKLDKIRIELDLKIKKLEEEKSEIINFLNTEKEVVERLKSELISYHQLNNQQNDDLDKTKENMKIYECEINKLNKNINELNININELNINNKQLNNELIDIKSQNESLNLNLCAMKESDNIQRNEIDETNKMLREIQIELKENKKELTEYQNRWQYERKQNDINIEKLRQYELTTNHLNHESKMNKTTITSKIKEIDRLNHEFKEQQKNLLQTMTDLADNKARLEVFNNDIFKLNQENQLLLKQIDNKQELINKIKTDYQFEKENLLKQINRYKQENHDINHYKNKLQQINKKQIELQNKYEILKKENNINLNNLDEKDENILNLNDKMEHLHIKFEKEKKEIQYKLNKKISDLNDTTNALCELQKEFDSKMTEIEQYNDLQKRQKDIYTKIENERNLLQIQYTEIIKKYETLQIELKIKEKKLIEIEENLKITINKLQQTTLQNERLKDDLNSITNGNDDSNLEKKYVKAKQIINEKNEIIQTIQKSLTKRKDRESKYQDAIIEWKKHTENLENKIIEQKKEINNLLPSKEKAKKFEILCKEYHRAKTNQFKAKLICRETQSIECKLPNYHNNKENIHK